ncbi:MAG: DUF1203 domain-containing protein [Geminicoccaceae bacterium]
MPFQISALPTDRFQHLFGADEDVLRAHGAKRMVVSECPGSPCRISLEDAAVGESVLLLNFEHLPVSSPYRSSHAILIRENAEQAKLAPGEVPEQLRIRLLSVRAFDQEGMMIDADVVEGTDLEQLVERMLAQPSVSYLHVHHAKPGCYGARIDRR